VLDSVEVGFTSADRTTLGATATAAALATARTDVLAAVDAVPTVGEIDLELTNTHGVGAWGGAEPISVGPFVAAIVAGVWGDSATYGAATKGRILRLLGAGLANRIVEAPGSPGTLILYDDDAVTPLLTWTLTDTSGAAVTAVVGAPARRSAAT